MDSLKDSSKDVKASSIEAIVKKEEVVEIK